MIEFHEMSFGYGKRDLFTDLSLSLQTGSVYGLLGLNGAGKTSLLKLTAGALRSRKGEIIVFGRDPGARSAEHLADLYFVPEDPWLPPLRPSAWLERYAVFRPAFDRGRFDRLFDELALDRDKLLTRYSYGQRKKFALAAALASGARTLLLDEPTNGLDIPSKGQLRRILAEAADPDRVVVVSTHQVRDLENLIDPIVVLHDGAVVFTLTGQELAGRLRADHLPSLDNAPVVYAERDAVGWSALLARPLGADNDAAAAEGGSPDLELVFDAAVAAPARLDAALRGEPLPPYRPEDHVIAKEANR
jgi:ABC-2 type transport system ATP-binding protein